MIENEALQTLLIIKIALVAILFGMFCGWFGRIYYDKF